MSLKEMAKANLARSNQTRESNPESDLAESFIREMDAATSFLALLQITDQIDPARFAQEEYDRLWGAYSRNRDRWPDEPYPATGWGTFNEADEATPPGASQTCLSGQETSHSEQNTAISGRPGVSLVTHDPTVCGCRELYSVSYKIDPASISQDDALAHHPDQITPAYGWTGREIVLHDPGTCRNPICANRRSIGFHTKEESKP